MTSDRAKTEIADFYKVYEGDKQWEDPQFPHSSMALYWASLDEDNGPMAKIESQTDLAWMRATEIFPEASLFGSDGIEVADITQGYIGNCWFIAAVAALAEFPGRIEGIFLNNQNKLSKNGIYGVNMYTLGMPHTILVDDYLPVSPNADGSFKTIYAEVSNDLGLWGPIIEKAFAKRYGNYEHIIGGLPSEAVRSLTGSPFVEYLHKDRNLEEMWQLLSTHDLENDFITCGTESGNDQDRTDYGLAKGHAYTVMSTKKLTNGKRLVKIRNPWGIEGYKGSYSDNSPLWDPQSKKEAGMETKNDGIFFVDIETYLLAFSETWISYNTKGWATQRFLHLNDESLARGKWDEACGWGCSRHELRLKADVEQTVYITPYTWNSRGIADKCENKDNNSYHAAFIDGKMDNI